MRDTSLLQLALGIMPPWSVTRSDFDAAARRLDIQIDFRHRRPVCLPRLRRTRLPGSRYRPNDLAPSPASSSTRPTCTPACPACAAPNAESRRS